MIYSVYFVHRKCKLSGVLYISAENKKEAKEKALIFNPTFNSIRVKETYEDGFEKLMIDLSKLDYKESDIYSDI